jgi:hypothetical protein
LIAVLSENTTIEQILSFEKSNFESNCDGINSATDQLTHIFENVSQKSCRTMKLKKIKSIKKKPWGDMEVRDLKRTVTNLGNCLGTIPLISK